MNLSSWTPGQQFARAFRSRVEQAQQEKRLPALHVKYTDSVGKTLAQAFTDTSSAKRATDRNEVADANPTTKRQKLSNDESENGSTISLIARFLSSK